LGDVGGSCSVSAVFVAGLCVGVTNCRVLVRDTTKVVLAAREWSRTPRPPWDTGWWAIRVADGGMCVASPRWARSWVLAVLMVVRNGESHAWRGSGLVGSRW
jgi:hypothetical protein